MQLKWIGQVVGHLVSKLGVLPNLSLGTYTLKKLIDQRFTPLGPTYCEQ